VINSRCGDSFVDHLAVVLVVDRAGADIGGQDQPVGGGEGLTVVALHPAATAQRLHPRLRIGDIGHALGGLGLDPSVVGGRARLVELGLRLAHPGILLDRHRAPPRTAPQLSRSGIERGPAGVFGLRGGDRRGQSPLGQRHLCLNRNPAGHLKRPGNPGGS
jgi:hypothetical protein